MPFLGTTPRQGFTSHIASQNLSANVNGSTTVFTLSTAVASENDLEVFVGNVRQEPGSGKAYTASGTTLTFTEAPPNGFNVYVNYKGQAQITSTPLDGSVSAAKLTNDAVTTVKISDDAITLAKANDNFYKAGTWTGSFRNFAEGGSGVTSDTTFTGRYTKIGDLVTIGFAVFNINITGMGSSDVLYLGGLPYKPTPNLYSARGATWTADINTGANEFAPVFLYLQANTNSGYFQLMEDNANPTTMTVTNFEDDLADIACTMSYHTDET
tara:strand:- start:1478 stop:2284 length:807 start_codon:yes stop_codon:yes gene_type:complete